MLVSWFPSQATVEVRSKTGALTRSLIHGFVGDEAGSVDGVRVG